MPSPASVLRALCTAVFVGLICVSVSNAAVMDDGVGPHTQFGSPPPPEATTDAHAYHAAATACGSAHPDITHTFLPTVTARQSYHQPAHVPSDVRRRLQFDPDQEYLLDIMGDFLPLSVADASGLAEPLRVRLEWEAMDYGEFSAPYDGTDSHQCTAVGQVIRVGCVAGGSLDCSHVCLETDVVAPGDAKNAVIKRRITFAEEFFHDALRVKPVRDEITVHPSIRNAFNINATEYVDTDLVVIITARPAPFTPVAAYASCLQRDQYFRCTVGMFNWVPAAISPDRQNAPEVMSAERHTALHELTHVLGGMAPSPLFIDATGEPRTTGVYTTLTSQSASYPKSTTFITTPKVTAMVREHYGCPDLIGMPLEDQPLGKGVHWEARVAGPEFMSYGTGTGETYVSDLTFAFLEDTNQYIANYSLGGRLVETPPQAPVRFGSLFFMGGSTEVDGTPPPYRSPGDLRWGKNQGCAFVLDSVLGWNDHYHCRTAETYGCSPDNRVSAVCTINAGITADTVFTCGEWSTGPQCSSTVLNDNCASGGSCGLPSMYQYFATDAEAIEASGDRDATAGDTGGHSSAMDYAPVSLGYWNCQDLEANNAYNNSLATSTEAGDTTDAAVDSSIVEEMDLYGGQSRCATCRCFQSSLIELSAGSFNPSFPSFGLCYRANCYKADYLQVGIKSQLSSEVFWYKCPSGGGKLLIPGFTGALNCPVASEFCSQEAVSHIKYPETIIWLEWLMWSLIMGVPFLFSFCCACVPPFRECLIRVSKRSCGVSHFTLLAPLDPRSRLAVIKDTIELAHKATFGKQASIKMMEAKKKAADPRVKAHPRRNRRRSWAGADLMHRSPRGINQAVNALNQGTGPSMASRKEARRLSQEFKAKAAAERGREKFQRAEKKVATSVRVAAGGRRIALQRVDQPEGDMYGKLTAGMPGAPPPPADAHAHLDGEEEYDDDRLPTIPRRSSAWAALGGGQAKVKNMPEWALALRPDEYGDAGVNALDAIAGAARGRGNRRGSGGAVDVIAQARQAQDAAALGGGLKAAQFGQRLRRKALNNIRARNRGTHRGWVAVRSMAWIPNEFGKPRFKADVLKEIIKSKGRKRKKILNRFRTTTTPGNAWKRGSITVLSSERTKPLFVSAVIIALLGLSVVGVAAAAMGRSSVRTFPVLATSGLIVLLGLIGIKGSSKTAEVASCLVVMYFYFVLAVFLGLVFASIWWFSFPSSVDRFLLSNWNTVTAVVPNLIDMSLNQTQQVTEFRETVAGDAPVFTCSLTFVVGVLAFALVSAARLLRVYVLFGTLFTVIHNVFVVFGLMMLATALYIQFSPGLVGNFGAVPLALGAGAGYMLLAAVMGHVASYRKMLITLKLYVMVTLLAFCVCCWLTWRVLDKTTGIPEYLAGLPSDELEQIAKDLQLDGVAIDLMEANITDMIRYLFTLLAFQLMLQLLLLVSTVVFIQGVHKVRELLSPAGIMRSKAEVRATMVFATLRGEDQAYETDLMMNNLRTSQDNAMARMRVATKMVGAHRLHQMAAASAAAGAGSGGGGGGGGGEMAAMAAMAAIAADPGIPHQKQSWAVRRSSAVAPDTSCIDTRSDRSSSVSTAASTGLASAGAVEEVHQALRRASQVEQDTAAQAHALVAAAQATRDPAMATAAMEAVKRASVAKTHARRLSAHAVQMMAAASGGGGGGKSAGVRHASPSFGASRRRSADVAPRGLGQHGGGGAGGGGRRRSAY